MTEKEIKHIEKTYPCHVIGLARKIAGTFENPRFNLSASQLVKIVSLLGQVDMLSQEERRP